MHGLAMYLGKVALVLKSFKIDAAAIDTPQVEIIARRGGLLSWLLTMVGVDVTAVFRVYRNRIEYSYGSLSGNIQNVMPLSALSIGMAGYTKPFALIALAALALLAAIILGVAINSFGLFLLFMIIATVLVIFYYLQKTLLISVVSHSGFAAGFAFKRSVIEGVRVDYEQALRVVRIVSDNIMAQTGK